MQSKGSSPTKSQKDYWSWLGSRGCAVCGTNPEIHHVKGAKYCLKIDGIKTQVGNWYVLPLCCWHHRDPNNASNVTNWKRNFEDEYGKQVEMVRQCFDEYAEEMGVYPFDVNILEALHIDSNAPFNDSAYE